MKENCLEGDALKPFFCTLHVFFYSFEEGQVDEIADRKSVV